MNYKKLLLLPLLLVGGLLANSASAAGADCAVVGGTLMKWPADKPIWEMCWIKPSQSVATDGSGLELRDIHYKGILVAKRMHAPILFAEYRNVSTCYRDWKDADANFIASAPVRNMLGIPVGYESTTSCDISQQAITAHGNCPFNNLPGSTFTSADCIVGTGAGGGVAIEDKTDHVVLTTQYSASWYQYTSRYIFWANGDIQPEFGYGNNNGTNNNLTHWHHNYWRWDFDIDGTGNNVIKANDVAQTTEFTGRRSLTGGPNGGPTYWDVITENTGGFGYRIVSGAGDYNPPNESGRTDTTTGLGLHTVDVIGSLFKNNEYADKTNNNLGDCAFVPGNIANNENIDKKDVVFWYTASVRDANGNNWPPSCGLTGQPPCEPQNSMVCKQVGPTITQIGDWPILRDGFDG